MEKDKRFSKWMFTTDMDFSRHIDSDSSDVSLIVSTLLDISIEYFNDSDLGDNKSKARTLKLMKKHCDIQYESGEAEAVVLKIVTCESERTKDIEEFIDDVVNENPDNVDFNHEVYDGWTGRELPTEKVVYRTSKMRNNGPKLICPTCNGSGKVDGEICPNCQGAGKFGNDRYRIDSLQRTYIVDFELKALFPNEQLYSETSYHDNLNVSGFDNYSGLRQQFETCQRFDYPYTVFQKKSNNTVLCDNTESFLGSIKNEKLRAALLKEINNNKSNTENLVSIYATKIFCSPAHNVNVSFNDSYINILLFQDDTGKWVSIEIQGKVGETSLLKYLSTLLSD